MLKKVSFPLRHRFLNFLLNQDIKGVRFLADKLPKILLPHPSKVGHCLLTLPNGLILEIDPSIDLGVEEALFLRGSYENGVLDFLAKIVNDQSVFLDIGANIGLMSLWVAKCHANATIHAFEANPSTVEILNRNIQLNKFNQIHVHSGALGAEYGTGEIYDNWEINRGGASMVVKSEQAKSFEIAITPLDAFHLAPTVIKMDVEGYELEVLKGAAQTIKNYLPIILFEILDYKRTSENSVGAGEEVVAFIRSLGDYQFFRFKKGSHRKSKLVPILNDEEFPNHDNVVAIPQKKELH